MDNVNFKMIEKNFFDLKVAIKKGLTNIAVVNAIRLIFSSSCKYLKQFQRIKLISGVSGKEYFAFKNGFKISRAINASLYIDNMDALQLFWEKYDSDSFVENDIDLIQRSIYTIAISFCAAIDLGKLGDQKTPGTFFEYLIGHFFAWRLNVEPQKSIQVLNIDNDKTLLPTDYVYNMGVNRPKFHLPVKTSSRERAIMMWAHQKLLDGVYGVDRFIGTPVLLAETKVDKKALLVQEICLPDQWRLYQLYISKLRRIYYLDVPDAYKDMKNSYPPLAVEKFAKFFFEYKELSKY